jgi:hypothetical protein
VTLDSIPQHVPMVVSRVIDGEAVLVDPEHARIRVLNAVGARIWELMDGQQTLGDIAQAITAEYEVDLPRAQTDVLAFCADLTQAGVLTPIV